MPDIPDPPPSRSSAEATPLFGRVFRRPARRLSTVFRVWRLYLVRLQILLVPTEAQRLFALTIGIGVVCGLAAVAFHLAIQLAESLMIERAVGAHSSWMAWTIVTPTAGALVCGLLLHYVVPNARGSGIPQVKATFALRGRRLRLRDSIGKFFIGALQLGSGSSLGREGPTVQICAGVATALGRAARVSPRSLRRLLPVGAAAGIAAAFNAPIAAVTFTIEEVVGNLDKSVLSGVIIAAALAAVIERSVLGGHPIFDVPSGHGLRHASSLLLYSALGIAAGLLSITFTDGLLIWRQRFRAWKGVPDWMKPGVGGLVTGVLAVIGIHFLGARGITGGGYAALGQALLGSLTVKVMLALCGLKMIATIFAYSSGGAGGIFAPSLFFGAMIGGAFGYLDVFLFGHDLDSVSSFALVGMGAAFAGIVRAPMTSVLIIIEMTDGYSLILPLMIANMTSYLIARRLRPTPVYEALLVQDDIHLRDPGLTDMLEAIPLEQVFVRDATFVSFDPTLRARDLVRVEGDQDVYPVVDATGVMVGIITTEDLKRLGEEPDLGLVVNATDIMRPPVSVGLRDDLRVALETMLENGFRRLPVLDADGKVAGLVDEAVLARAFLRGQLSAD